MLESGIAELKSTTESKLYTPSHEFESVSTLYNNVTMPSNFSDTVNSDFKNV